ncbi:unnamed protein product, partial [Ectocarpus sp. 8 AP-2014]
DKTDTAELQDGKVLHHQKCGTSERESFLTEEKRKRNHTQLYTTPARKNSNVEHQFQLSKVSTSSMHSLCYRRLLRFSSVEGVATTKKSDGTDGGGCRSTTSKGRRGGANQFAVASLTAFIILSAVPPPRGLRCQQPSLLLLLLLPPPRPLPSRSAGRSPPPGLLLLL